MTLLPFNLPSGFEPLVREGQEVKEGEVIAQNKNQSDTFVEVAKSLEIQIRDVRSAVVKNPGDSVEENDVLAQKKGLMGGAQVLSPLSGTIVRIDEENGGVVIRGAGQTVAEKLLSPVDGVVTICNNEKILIKTDKPVLAIQKGCGEEAVGECVLLKETVDSKDLDNSIDGKILVGGLFSREAIAKAFGLGAIGIIAKQVSDSDFETFEERNIKTPVVIVEDKDSHKFLKGARKIMIDIGNKVIVKL